MFEQFNEQSREVVASSEDEAQRLRHNYLGTEHLLLGLLREREGPVARVLEGFGLALEPVRDYVVMIVGSSEPVASGQIPLTPRAKRVLELGMREALDGGHAYVGPDDLLLGLMREGGGVAARILLDHGMNAKRVREELNNPSTERSEAVKGPMVAVTARVAAAAALELAAVKALEENRPADLGDLLLALVEGWPEDLVARGFDEAGVDTARLREAFATARRRSE